MAKKTKPAAGANAETPNQGTTEAPADDKPAKKGKRQTTAERIAEEHRRDAQELRDSADRQEQDKALLKKDPRFLTAIRAKRKLAAELEAKADALTK